MTLATVVAVLVLVLAGLVTVALRLGGTMTTAGRAGLAAPSPSPTFVVYVQAKARYSVTGIPDGTYELYLRTGVDWDPAGKGFTRDCNQEKFTDTFKFATTAPDDPSLGARPQRDRRQRKRLCRQRELDPCLRSKTVVRWGDG
jgi:hypothetical protein